MHPSSLRKHTTPLVALSLLSLAAISDAATYQWRDANSEGSGGSFNGWLLAGNYDAGGAGNIAPTGADDLFYNSAVARSVAFNSSGTVGLIRFGANTAITNGFASSANAATVITLDGSGRADAGLKLEAGAGNINFNPRLRFVGEVVFDNSAGVTTSSIDLGSVSNGRGGFEGSGNLSIINGKTIIRDVSAGGLGYTNTGTTTIRQNGNLQVTGGTTYTSSAISVGSSGTLSGTGTVGVATIASGGRVSVGGDGSATATVGTLTFTNLLTLQAGGEITIDIRTAGADRIAADGGIVIEGGELRLRLHTEYTTTGTYTLFSGLTGNNGNFEKVTIRSQTDSATNVNLVDDGTGIWSGDFDLRGLHVVYNANTGVLELTSIPEPGALAASLVGATMLAVRRRRR